MKKLRRKDGFTLIEMLIVVAIVAILIAVSIPLVGSALDRAREATDAANERAAKAEILICYMSDSEYAPGKKVIANSGGANSSINSIYAYDAANGKLIQAAPAVRYGKCSNHRHENGYLLVWVKEGGSVSMCWTSGEFPKTGLAPNAENYNLCGPTLND